MNINDYKDGNGNVLVSENLVSDLIGGINGVVESGSNANGSWIKFADGTLFCSGEFSVTASGNVIDITKNFPTSSTVSQIIIPSLGDNGQSNWAGNLYTGSSAGDSYRLVAVNCVTNGNYKIRFASWGRWK